jgi:metal-responsive CopG/Arc/MetJ family transcriptional regulator
MITLAITRQVKRYVYPVQLDEEELEALDTIVERLHSSKSGAIREAIRNYGEQLKGTEVIKIREVSRRQVRKEILEFLKKNERAWSSEIADSLRIDLSVVNGILEELWSERRVKPTA